MYGIVNKAIKELVVANFGEEKWEIIREKSGVDIDFFLSNEPYDDEITFRLATAVSEEMEMTIEEVLTAFGEWWILKTTKDKYASLMDSGGSTLKEFILNLPNFHNRLMLVYPKLSPPEFKISAVMNNSLHLHYVSNRVGFQEFVRGLLQGLAKRFQENIEIHLIQSRNEGHSHEIFKIIWV
ncbi:heme NO-binding domain-containing protein [Flavobacterium sp.]|jgi:hypothetical protein|uniref:heme NO-binding domain-containing protein n=1 Tax=Flavobacterium sp. TaxID=239 RepID=UPI0037C0774E